LALGLLGAGAKPAPKLTLIEFSCVAVGVRDARINDYLSSKRLGNVRCENIEKRVNQYYARS